MGEILAKVDEPLNIEGKTPFVILMVGVNGVGKTTTIGKLARQFEQQGKSVMLAAGDTFRAAAVEQLQVWGQRNNIPVIAQHTGADSASVIFDAIQAAKARNVDVLIADTAGRLQNKSHLMEELKKIVRVMKKLDDQAPHEVMLTLDASTGQNAVSQAKLFNEAVGLTGITLTKLDGTAKGGVIFAIADQFGIPIRYIGVGEGIEDLRPFKADDFIEALFARED
jgi:fused signal recognition particle receptor